MICQQHAMKFSAHNKRSIYFELGKFVRSGFGFDKACEAILAQPGAPACQRVFCSAILDGLKTKKTIGQAIAATPLNISPLEINLISAGEEAGRLEQSFAHLARHFEQSVKTRRKILKGLAYPVVLLHAGAILGTLVVSMLTAWNPQAQAGAGWRVFTTGAAILLGGYLLAILGSLAIAWWIRQAKSSPLADRLLSLIPLLGVTVGSLAMSRFCEVFHMSLHSGRKIDHCLRSAGSASESGILVAASEGGATLINKGASLAEALSATPDSFPAEFRRSIANAELAGVLDEDFQRWSDHYRNTAVEAVDRLTEWCPRLFYWGVLLVVALVVIRMAMAYRGLLEGYLDWSDQF
jgi:type II secretory pathway component PulF